MPVTIDDAWSYHGLRVIQIQNEILRLDVLPERGGNIFRLIDKPRDLDLLWISPRVAPHLAALGADFDDHWAGGWDDAFPGGRSSRNRRQTDTVKAARRIGVPSVFGVGSWDHLTTKGVVKARPDATLVWNELQRRDAAELHAVPSDSASVTAGTGWVTRRGASGCASWGSRSTPSSSKKRWRCGRCPSCPKRTDPSGTWFFPPAQAVIV